MIYGDTDGYECKHVRKLHTSTSMIIMLSTKRGRFAATLEKKVLVAVFIEL
jgi:hypothetical protein